jgi:hypothetical protein
VRAVQKTILFFLLVLIWITASSGIAILFSQLTGVGTLSTIILSLVGVTTITHFIFGVLLPMFLDK